MPAHILIVEDDQIIAADLSLKMQGLGHEVIGIAISGEEALGLAGQSKPDLVLMDIQLDTAMNGGNGARIIQERTGASIIFVTAFPRAALHDESIGMLEEGIYLQKPFSRIQLETAVDNALRRRSQGDTA
jgi:DNA-binding response OmpR family regulator